MTGKDRISVNTTNSSDPLGWGNEFELAICEHCDWRYYLSEGIEKIRCPYCYSSILEKITGLGPGELQDRPPEMVLPFSIPPEMIETSVSLFTKGIPFPPEDLSHQKLQARLCKLYLPIWMLDTKVDAKWWAEAGFNYQVVSHQSEYTQKFDEWRTREVEETRIRWEPRLGTLSRTYENITTAALDEYEEIISKMGGFDLVGAQSYHPELIEQSVIRLPNREITDAWVYIKPILQSLAGDECRQAIAANHIRRFRWVPEYQDKNWTLLLLPLYSTYYFDDENNPQPVFIHGQTGRISGIRRASMRRALKNTVIVLAVAILIFLISIGVSVASLMIPVFLIAGIIGFVAATLAGIGSFIPVILAWNFNRTNKESGLFEELS